VSADRSPNDSPNGIGLTRWRDLTMVALAAGLIGYLLLQWNYHRLPPLPRLAGIPAVLIGFGEAGYGWGLRNRINQRGRTSGTGQLVRPVEPLAAARAVLIAKATALGAAALGGLWLGVLIYVLPLAGEVSAAAGDRTSAVIGVASALVMLAGGLFLERCCRTPDPPDPPDGNPAI
jgi:hypothetical protein